MKRVRDSKDLTNEPDPELRASWTHCLHYLKTKRRFCNLSRTASSDYCGNHRPEAEGATERVLRKGNEGTRIPCPVDPSHTIYLHNLDSHVRKCNASKHANTLETQPYFCRDCNSGRNESDDPASAVDPDELARKIVACFTEHVSGQLSEPGVVASSDNTEKLCMEKLAADQTSFNQLRHVQQDARIIDQMEHFGLVGGERRAAVFLELGAGKGKLGVSLHTVYPASQVVFVERSGQRRKAERSSDASSVHRIRMDIRHCQASRLPFAESGEVILVAKHLCGVATDLALRSLEGFNKAALRGRGFTPVEFELMKYWAGWATSFREEDGVETRVVVGVEAQEGEGQEGEGREHPEAPRQGVLRPNNKTRAELREIGAMVKRIIDQGRVQFIRDRGLDSTQRNYCSAALSPECFLILAKQV